MGLGHDRGSLGRLLGLERVGVGLERQAAVGRHDLVLVARARLDVWQKQLPDPA
jgi:hypothetical protein